ncbi:MAG: helix-turn-helix domain-containing protein [Magnetococcales bacterium]|nr:helix-turn-helix domain-containing protein [Magnetococcales bacterium]
MDTLAERLVWARKKAGLNKSQLARLAGVKPQSVIQWEAGRTGIAKRNIDAVARQLQVSPEWLQFGRTVQESAVDTLHPRPPMVHRVPLISWQQAAFWTGMGLPSQSGGPERWVDTTRPVGRRPFALRMTGDSMEPLVPSGATIIVDPDVDAVHNSLVVVRLGSGLETTFKQWVIDGGHHLLKPINPRYPILSLENRLFFLCGVARQILIDLD